MNKRDELRPLRPINEAERARVKRAPNQRRDFDRDNLNNRPRKKKKFNKGKKNRILLILLLMVIVFALIKSGVFSKNTTKKVEELPEEEEQLELGTDLIEKYGEEGLKDRLRSAKENFEYDPDKSFISQFEELKEYIPEAQLIIDHMRDIPGHIMLTTLMFPENFMWTYGYISEQKGTEALIEQAKYKDIPYYIQTDSRWGYKKEDDLTVGFVGCGPTAMAMVASAITGDETYTPDRMMDYVVEKGHYSYDVGTHWSFWTDAPKEFGFKSRELALDKEAIYNELQKGNYIIVSVGPGDFTYGGHYIVLAGIEDGELKVLDPNSWINTEKTWTYEKIKPQVKNLWVFSK